MSSDLEQACTFFWLPEQSRFSSGRPPELPAYVDVSSAYTRVRLPETAAGQKPLAFFPKATSQAEIIRILDGQNRLLQERCDVEVKPPVIDLSTAAASATSAIAVVLGFGMAFLVGKKIFLELRSRAERSLFYLGLSALGLGLSAVFNELLGLPFQGLHIRIDKLIGYSIAYVLIAPGLFWGMLKVMTRKPSTLSNTVAATNQHPVRNYSDEKLYETALKELEGAERQAGLWARSFAECDGDESKAKARYIRERVGQMRQNDASR